MSGNHRAIEIDRVEREDSVSYLYRCCADPRTDSWITIYHPHQYTDDQIDAQKKEHAAGRELRHRKKQAAESYFEGKRSGAVSHSARDLAGKKHDVIVVAHEHEADEIIRVTYQCCGELAATALFDRLHEKETSDLDALVVEHATKAATRHANVVWHERRRSTTAGDRSRPS